MRAKWGCADNEDMNGDLVNDTYMVKEGHKELSGIKIGNCIFVHFSLLTRDSPTPVWHLSSLTPEKSTSWTPSKYADVVISKPGQT